MSKRKPTRRTTARRTPRKRRTVVYTYGVFDLFHSGHVQLLKKAKKLGDRLVVGLFTDKVVTAFKREPVISFEHRKVILEHLTMVDIVIPQNKLLPDANILRVRPHILAKGPGAGWDDGLETVPGEKSIRKVGGKIVRLPYHHGISTSEIIKKIRN